MLNHCAVLLVTLASDRNKLALFYWARRTNDLVLSISSLKVMYENIHSFFWKQTILFTNVVSTALFLVYVYLGSGCMYICIIWACQYFDWMITTPSAAKPYKRDYFSTINTFSAWLVIIPPKNVFQAFLLVTKVNT